MASSRAGSAVHPGQASYNGAGIAALSVVWRVGRDDGAEAGEYAPLFYRRDRFNVQEQGYFWLSETPDVVGSFGWDADCVRIATWAKLYDRTQNHTLLFLNTHFDHRGMTAQQAAVGGGQRRA